MNHSFVSFVFQDWSVNAGNPRGRIFLMLFRLANFCSKGRLYRYLGAPYIIFYKLVVQWIFNLEVPWNIDAGRGLKIYHCIGLVINKGVTIGSDCTLRHCTTIGNKENSDGTMSACPRLGNNVDVGCNVCVIGGITIGDNVRIGSGSVVVKSVPANCVVAGNPAIVRSMTSEAPQNKASV